MFFKSNHCETLPRGSTVAGVSMKSGSAEVCRVAFMGLKTLISVVLMEAMWPPSNPEDEFILWPSSVWKWKPRASVCVWVESAEENSAGISSTGARSSWSSSGCSVLDPSCSKLTVGGAVVFGTGVLCGTAGPAAEVRWHHFSEILSRSSNILKNDSIINDIRSRS